MLTWLIVAPVTRTVRGIPTEIALDTENGVDVHCAASFDDLQPIRRSFLTQRAGRLLHPRKQICSALGALADC
ncbi:MAG: hypothetical protein ACRDLD_12425 [Thermoleophilaceae bacterium]